ncbi:hypothetical protein D3C71_1809060 [compost metagenome]
MMMGTIARTSIAIIAPISIDPYPPFRYCIAIGMVLYSVPINRSGKRKSFHTHITLRIATVTAIGLRMGNTTLKNACGGLHPSIITASSTSSGMDFTNPLNINTDSPDPNPR